MKWLTALVVVILAGTVVVSAVGGIVADDEQSSIPVTRPPVTSAPSTPTASTIPGQTVTTLPSTPTTTTGPSFTAAELAQHSSSTSCWLLVDGRVYDVTSYLRSHPGGSRTILPWCGKESTVAFASEDGRGEHSDEAYELLEKYFIGELRI